MFWICYVTSYMIYILIVQYDEDQYYYCSGQTSLNPRPISGGVFGITSTHQNIIPKAIQDFLLISLQLQRFCPSTQNTAIASEPLFETIKFRQPMLEIDSQSQVSPPQNRVVIPNKAIGYLCWNPIGTTDLLQQHPAKCSFSQLAKSTKITKLVLSCDILCNLQHSFPKLKDCDLQWHASGRLWRMQLHMNLVGSTLARL